MILYDYIKDIIIFISEYFLFLKHGVIGQEPEPKYTQLHPNLKLRPHTFLPKLQIGKNKRNDSCQESLEERTPLFSYLTDYKPSFTYEQESANPTGKLAQVRHIRFYY